MFKVLEGKQTSWPAALHGVLFAYRTSKQSFTGFSPFYLPYSRTPKLPRECYLSNNLSDSCENDESLVAQAVEDTSNKEDIHTTLKAILTVHGQDSADAHKNIKNAQDKLKRDYKYRHRKKEMFIVGEKVLL